MLDPELDDPPTWELLIDDSPPVPELGTDKISVEPMEDESPEIDATSPS